MDNQFFLKNLWLWKCGLLEMNNEIQDIDKLKKTEWSPEFEQLMRNRLIQGALRYGLLNNKNKHQFKRIEYVIKKAKEYNKTKNKELLIDIANLCLLEFEEGNGFFKSLHDIDHITTKNGL